MSREQWKLLAGYNAWMNENIYAAAAGLPADELRQDRKAFFGSILGTLNHIAVGDTTWLKRFRMHLPNAAALEPLDHIPAPQRLDQILFEDLQDLARYRKTLDGMISSWIETIAEEDLGGVMCYKNMKGVESRRRFSLVLLHFFNHQTHHRGQVSTLLYQAGVDVGVTDLLVQVPEVT